jgi:serine/threonine protein kinase
MKGLLSEGELVVKIFDLGDPSIEAAAEAEANILMELKHPNIVRMKKIFVSRLESKTYLVLERAPGITLDSLLEEKKSL